ncbi:MAG TPA: hypothetical protein VMT67_09150 [Terriglobales bacterium]|nr:hypothetical protein [Terriglobales bacterium]
MKYTLQSKRPLVLDLDILDRVHPVPQLESAGDHNSDQQANAEEQPVARHRNKKDNDDRERNNQAG